LVRKAQKSKKNEGLKTVDTGGGKKRRKKSAKPKKKL